jgi:hypothetical protein
MLRGRYARRRDEVVAYFLSQVTTESRTNWDANCSRTRELYCDYMASNWSRKMRFLRALDTANLCREDALEQQIMSRSGDQYADPHKRRQVPSSNSGTQQVLMSPTTSCPKRASPIPWPLNSASTCCASGASNWS